MGRKLQNSRQSLHHSNKALYLLAQISPFTGRDMFVRLLGMQTPNPKDMVGLDIS